MQLGRGLLRSVDPTGLVTTLEYDLRGRVVSRQVGNELTTYTYDDVGQLLRLTRPDGSFVSFTYDPAHRLTAITDHLGNTITYRLDAVGNPTQEQVFDPQGTLVRTQSWVFDALNRLERSVGAQGQTTFYAYDANDQLTAVTDALGHQTAYGYDGLGDLTRTTSPDTRLTQHTYDKAGNAVSRTDARGQRTTSRYDAALNRVTDVKFSDGAVAFTYDEGTNGIGRLTQMTDDTGTTRWKYDAQGRVLRKTQQVANRTFVTQYRYDAFGRVVSITYPSGQRIDLLYTNGLVTQIRANGATLLRDIQYQPFGPPRAWVWGDGTPYSRQFDLDGRVVTYDLGGAGPSADL